MKSYSRVLRGVAWRTVLRFLLVSLSLGTADEVRALDLAEALDTTNLTWTTSGWTGQTNIAHDGVDAAVCERSQAVYLGGSLQSLALASGGEAIAFWWKLSIPVNRGSLEFYVDGVKRASITGEVAWERRSFLVPAGQRALIWRFVPDGTYYNGAYQNSAWLDEVAFVNPNSLAFLSEPTNQTVAAGEPAALAGPVAGVEPMSYFWFLNGTNLPAVSGPVLALTNA